MAHIDPHSPEGLAYLSDYMEGGFSIEDAIHDELTTCEICGRHFTDFDDDFDHGADGRMCWDCSDDGDCDPREHSTYHVRNGSVVG
jgi:hypothetical protein